MNRIKAEEDTNETSNTNLGRTLSFSILVALVANLIVSTLKKVHEKTVPVQWK